MIRFLREIHVVEGRHYWRFNWMLLSPFSIHTKNARFFCCGNYAADISKPHAFKWGTLADDVFPSANFTLPPKSRPPTGPI